MNEEQIIKEAMAALESDNSEQRAIAIEVLGEREHKAAVPKILALLVDADPRHTVYYRAGVGAH